jgi:hypothetical protein
MADETPAAELPPLDAEAKEPDAAEAATDAVDKGPEDAGPAEGSKAGDDNDDE